jgi:hypothetical protein
MLLELEDKEVDFIATLIAQVPTGTSVQQNMIHLLPKIVSQANQQLNRVQVGSEAPSPEA